MARIADYIYAFFNPNVALNEDGEYVHADGFFDSGNGSTDYISPEESGIPNFLLDPSSDVWHSEPDYSLDYEDSVNDMIEKINESVKTQNENAQTSADRAMEFSADQAELNRQFQKEMYEDNWNRQMEASNTAYQRAMADLKAAGLNPKLVSKIGGATTPSVAAPSGSSGSGQSAQMTAANLAPLSNLVSTYITGADALDRNENDFVRNIMSSLITAAGIYLTKGASAGAAAGASTAKLLS